MTTLVYAEQTLYGTNRNQKKLRKKILKHDVELWNVVTEYDENLDGNTPDCLLLPITLRLNLWSKFDDELVMWIFHNIRNVQLGAPIRLSETTLDRLIDYLSEDRFDYPEFDLLLGFKGMDPSLGWEFYLKVSQ